MTSGSTTPRATWKQRLAAGGVLVVFSFMGRDGWVLSQGTFSLSQVIGWVMILMAVGYVPMAAIVVLTGSMSRNMKFMLDPASYTRTFSETRAKVAREIEEERKRSRGM